MYLYIGMTWWDYYDHQEFKNFWCSCEVDYMMLVWLATLDYGGVFSSPALSKALLPPEWPWALGWIRGTPLVSFFIGFRGVFLCWPEPAAGYDSSSAGKGTGPWVSRVEGNTAFPFMLPNWKCAHGKQPLNSVCSYSGVQTQGPNWHRACDASALAFNSQPELMGLIDRQRTERCLQWDACLIHGVNGIRILSIWSLQARCYFVYSCVPCCAPGTAPHWFCALKKLMKMERETWASWAISLHPNQGSH